MDWFTLKNAAIAVVGAVVGYQLFRVLKLVLLDVIQTKDFRKQPLPKDLPNQVLLKTQTESFNHEYYVVARQGRIYFKRKESDEQLAKMEWNQWSLLGKDGLPRPGYFANPNPSGWFAFGFKKPSRIEEVDADGDNLICIGDNRVIYYLKWPELKWQGRWGLYLWLGVALGPPSWIQMPTEHLGYAISHRGAYNNYMEDINGTIHHSVTGCTTLYLLDPDQLNIYYVDPWLSPYWMDHHFEGPTLSALASYTSTQVDRHRIKMAYMKASGSNLFVVSTTGQLFTRLVDFDIAGMNPVFKYTYQRKHFETDTVRALPDPGWVQQKTIMPSEGRITKLLTIFQCGQGSKSYKLRVAGFDNKKVKGYFEKDIVPADAAWTFVPCVDLPITEADIVNMGEPETAPLIGADYTSTQLIDGQAVTITLKQYNPMYSETDVVVTVNNKPLKYDIKLYTVGLFTKYKGTLVVPEDFIEENPYNLFSTLFIDRKILPVRVKSPSKQNDKYVNHYQSPHFDIRDRIDKDSTKITDATVTFLKKTARHIHWHFTLKQD